MVPKVDEDADASKATGLPVVEAPPVEPMVNAAVGAWSGCTIIRIGRTPTGMAVPGVEDPAVRGRTSWDPAFTMKAVWLSGVTAMSVTVTPAWIAGPRLLLAVVKA